MTGRVFVLTHGNDLDGLGSAALIVRNLGAQGKDVFFLNYSDERLKYAERHVLGRMVPGDLIFICDTSLNDAQIGLFNGFIKKVKNGKGSVFWFDHHYWTKRQINSVASLCDIAIVGENEYACAAEITGHMLQAKGKFDRELMRMAHYTDFNLSAKDRKSGKKRLAKMYSLAFAYYNSFDGIEKLNASLGGILSMLSSGEFSNAKVEGDAKEFEKINDDRTKRMVKVLHNISVNISVGFSPTIDSTHACEAIKRASKRDIGMYVNTSSMKCHLRSTRTDVSGLALALGGGGHPHAAAFNIDAGEYAGFTGEKMRMKLINDISKAAKKCGL